MMKTLLFLLLLSFSHGFSPRPKHVPLISNIEKKSARLGTFPCNLRALPDASIIEYSSSLLSSELDGIFSNENIKKAFSLGTFGPQLLWLLMILIPRADVTKKVMGGFSGILFFSLVHLYVVVASASHPDGTAPLTEFQGVFDASPEADPQTAMLGMMRYPNFVTEEWTHVLTWDLFVGRWIWLDGLKRNIFTAHSVLLCNLIGPPGLLLHFLTCVATSKGFPKINTSDEKIE